MFLLRVFFFDRVKKIQPLAALKFIQRKNCVTPWYIRVKRHLHFLNAVIRVQIQQTAVHGEGQEVDAGTCCSEKHGKFVWYVGDPIVKSFLLKSF